MMSGLIFLIGMPAAGKTYWGERIAGAYGFRFMDLDAFIAGQEQMSVPAMFSAFGEDGFRERETAHLSNYIHNCTEPTVVACGGGTPCFNDNLELMKDSGIVVYLQADIAYLLHNLARSADERPLLDGRPDKEQLLHGLLARRASYYEQAHHILQSADISVATFAEIVSHV